MKDYFINVMFVTVKEIEGLSHTFKQLSGVDNIKGSTIFMDNGSTVEVREDDNIIQLIYSNPNNGIICSTEIMWADYIMEASNVIKSLIIRVSERETSVIKRLSASIRDMIVNGLDLKQKDILESTDSRTIIEFNYDKDIVSISIFDNEIMEFKSTVLRVSVPVVKLTGPEVLIEGVIKPYLDLYERFYK